MTIDIILIESFFSISKHLCIYYPTDGRKSFKYEKCMCILSHKNTWIPLNCQVPQARVGLQCAKR